MSLNHMLFFETKDVSLCATIQARINENYLGGLDRAQLHKRWQSTQHTDELAKVGSCPNDAIGGARVEFISQSRV
jgi:hypothetical protein